LTERRRSAREDKEALELVYESIRVAENIFDSLIDFEAHDDSDQMMNLQYEKVDWWKLIDSVVAPLKLQVETTLRISPLPHLTLCNQTHFWNSLEPPSPGNTSTSNVDAVGKMCDSCGW
jgi:hypothetical protein